MKIQQLPPNYVGNFNLNLKFYVILMKKNIYRPGKFTKPSCDRCTSPLYNLATTTCYSMFDMLAY